jgi:hypothetical protein
MSDTTAWEDYCEASLDLSNQDDVGEAACCLMTNQFPDATKMVLFPAAQAVRKAYYSTDDDLAGPALAAALRAAADQVAPSDADEPRNSLPMAIECQRIRAELLAIAAELEGK